MIDNNLDEIEELKGDLPSETRELEAKVAELQAQLAALEHEMKTAFSSRDDADSEIINLKKKLEKYKKQQFEVRNNREYDALSREMDAATATIARLEKEMESISELLQSPSHPFSAIVGGSKISTKIGLLSKLLDTVDELFIGGAMCLPFLKAQGKLPHATIDEEQVKIAHQILTSAESKNKKIHLPVDFHCSDALSNPKYEVLTCDQITKQTIAYDLGEKTLESWETLLKKSKTIFWNGPLGAYEWAPYDLISKSLAKTLAASSIPTIVIGGGDTVACFENIPLQQNVFLSTGGGATLELLENGSLPGYQALSEYEDFESNSA